MKVEIRFCNQCKRRTIQADDIYSDRHFCPAKLVQVWYCPNCGSRWKVVKKQEEIRVDEL